MVEAFMPKGPFLPSEFVPTKFSTAQDKADFGNSFLHFIESEWARTAFSKSFYNRLSMCFSHIAHYDAAGFYETWFPDPAPQMSVEQVRDLLTPTYPEIATATLTGPEDTGTALRYTFCRAIGSKG
jgi:PRTRC genetic system protein C